MGAMEIFAIVWVSLCAVGVLFFLAVLFSGEAR